MKQMVMACAIVLLGAFLTSATMAGQQLSQREQLKQMMDKLAQNPANQAQREEIIKMGAAMLPQPAVPEDARQSYIEGMTLHQDAKSPGDEKIALDSYRKALALAPWWGDAYLGQAVSQELSGDLEGAIQSLKDYLLSGPAADQARSAQDHIYALGAKLKKQAAASEAANESIEQRKKLSGYWKCKSGCTNPYAVVNSDGADFHANIGGFQFEGHFEGDAVTGLVTIPGGRAPNSAICNLPQQSHHMTVYLEEGGKLLRFEYENVTYTTREHTQPDPIWGNLSPVSVCDGVTPAATNPQEAELVGGPKKSYIGVSVETITQEVAAAETNVARKRIYQEGFNICNKSRKLNSAGALVTAVDPGSPAATAGFKAGDIINRQKNALPTCIKEDIVNLVNNYFPGTALTLEVYSDNNKPWPYTVRSGEKDAY